MSNRLLYSSKNTIQCAPLRSFKSRETAFRFGAWFAASQGNEKAARFCEDAGIKVDRALSEGINTAGGVLVGRMTAVGVLGSAMPSAPVAMSRTLRRCSPA